MAEDYLTDDEQLDAVKRWMAEYAPMLIIGAVLGVGGYFGWHYYRGRQDARALEAAAQFEQMTTSLRLNDTKKAREIAAGLIKNYAATPYADQAQLTVARLEVEAGQDAGAVGPLSAVMNDSKDADLRQIARLRLARVLIDQGKPDEAIKLLADAAPASFAGRYHEVRGDALYAKNDIAAATTEYKAALAAAEGGGADAAVLDLKLADLSTAGKTTDQTKKAMN